ncbi:MAG TPA: poly(A) polymerase [Nitrospirota bacterium]|nr:poly(A) polymerase [Nitrospirota bacterium]
MSTLEPTIIPRSGHTISRKWISPNAVRVLYRLKEKGYHAYLVGGGVRDLLLGREPKDFDIATNATPNEVKKLFRNCRLIGRRFRLAHVHFHNEIIEVATFRSNQPEEPESETIPEALPVAEVKEPAGGEIQADIPAESQPEAAAAEPAAPSASAITAPERPRPPRMLKTEDGMILRDNVFGTPEQDAVRRDFTVNAMFYNIADFSVIDYVGGMKDLRSGLIRIIGDPVVRFTEDPVRMVRAIRFAAILGFEIEESTERALLDLKDRVALASPSRMYEEVLKLFLQGEAEKTYQLLRKSGLFGVIFPGLNAWVDLEHEGYPHTWIGKALEWVDVCMQTGRGVEPHILFTLLYGQYVEEKARELRTAGMPPVDALTAAISGIMGEQVQRVQIPKKIGLAMRDIYWNQQRFEKREGKHPRYFLRRPGFADAFEYLRFITETTGERPELRAWWKEFIKSDARLHAGDGQVAGKGQERRGRPTRRRRRRGGKGRPGEPKPKA